MAGESYYFLLSVIAVLIATLHVVNILYFRAEGRTILGENVKPGMPGHEKFKKLSSSRGLIIAVALQLVFIANLVHVVNRLLNLGDRGYAHGMLTFGSVAVALFFIVMLLVMRNRFKPGGR